MGLFLFFVAIDWAITTKASPEDVVQVVYEGQQEIEPTNEDYCQAIYWAEGENAKWPYGIKGVYEYGKAKRICLNTIRNNRIRYKEYGYKEHDTFISFLASRYAPTRGESLNKAERRLNKYWLKNVQWFLNNPRG